VNLLTPIKEFYMSDSNVEKRKSVFKLQHPAVIHNPDPDKHDFLDCIVLKQMKVDELQKLKLMLPVWSVSYLRVHYQIKVLTYNELAALNIRAVIVPMDRIHHNKIAIINSNLDEDEGHQADRKVH